LGPTRRVAVLLVPCVLALAFAVHAQTRPSTPARPSSPPAAATPPAQRAPSEDDGEIDKVAATVNDEVILASEVEEQLFVAVQRAQGRPAPAELDTLRRRILEQMIDERLIIAEAKRQGIAVSDAELSREVESALAEVRERMGGDEAFRAQLERENTTEARLRDRYKGELQRQMMGQRLVQKLFPRKPVPQAEAEAWFAANKSRFPRVPGELRLSVIQVPPTPDSVALATGRRRALDARNRILKGERFAKVAQEVSEDPSSANSGGDLGFFPRGRFEPALENAAFSLRNGDLSQPVQTPFGWHLVQPIERDTLTTAAGRDSLGPDGKPWVEVHARHILIRVTPTEADIERARTLATRVRDEARKGTPWATLVRRYSRFEGASGEDGDLGFVSLASLQPSIRAGVDTLEVGQASEVLTNPAGFNIFKVTDRRPEREYALEEIREELPEAVAQMQFREKMEAWVQTLRAKARVEVRL
jgi:peptidyl-prolyl cis-trans isomerase SurA